MTISDRVLVEAEIEHGRVSAAALAVMQEPIAEAKEKLLRKLIMMYRAKETTHDVLVGIAAELSALDGLVEGLTGNVRRAETVFAKEHDNAQDRKNIR